MYIMHGHLKNKNRVTYLIPKNNVSSKVLIIFIREYIYIYIF